jgi:hypothetical protein
VRLTIAVLPVQAVRNFYVSTGTRYQTETKAIVDGWKPASSLGLEAQREAVSRYLNGGRWQLVQEVVEVESGKRNRPAIAEALRLCRLHKATLIIAELDRLARNVSISLARSWNREWISSLATSRKPIASPFTSWLQSRSTRPP